jgi:hypothetical protein
MRDRESLLVLNLLTELDAFKQSQNSSETTETIEQNIDVDNEAFFDEYPDWQVSLLFILIT